MVDDKPDKLIQPTFKLFAEQLITEMMELKKTGNALVYQNALNQFVAVGNNEKLLFSEIDYVVLEQFSTHLLKKGLKINTVSNYLRTLRAIYNKAIKMKVVDRSLYPFHNNSNLKF